ncbi:MAG: ABC transporter ATP-binding protein [Clostridiaceae bacterium]
MDKILEIKNLKKDYKKFSIKNLSLTLDRGYVMGFIGPNGAGKSTTIKLIMNLIRKNSGEIKLFGLDNIKNEREVKERIGFVYDENYYYEELTIDKMKRIIAPFYKNWSEDTFTRYLKDFELDKNQKIKKLSKGMKMKFSLAAALSHKAELIIMDEPTGGLDPVFRREIIDILYSLIQDENKSIFFSTHITTDLDKIADYVTFINKGELVFSKEKDEIAESYSLVKGGLELLNSESKNDFIGIKRNSFGFEALTDKKQELIKKYRDKAIFEKASLEDIMFHTVKGENL